VAVLDKFLKTAVELGADVLEFEFDGGDMIVMAFRATTGTGIGSFKSKTKECRQLINAIRLPW